MCVNVLLRDEFKCNKIIDNKQRKVHMMFVETKQKTNGSENVCPMYCTDLCFIDFMELSPNNVCNICKQKQATFCIWNTKTKWQNVMYN